MSATNDMLIDDWPEPLAPRYAEPLDSLGELIQAIWEQGQQRHARPPRTDRVPSRNAEAWD